MKKTDTDNSAILFTFPLIAKIQYNWENLEHWEQAVTPIFKEEKTIPTHILYNMLGKHPSVVFKHRVSPKKAFSHKARYRVNFKDSVKGNLADYHFFVLAKNYKKYQYLCDKFIKATLYPKKLSKYINGRLERKHIITLVSGLPYYADNSLIPGSENDSIYNFFQYCLVEGKHSNTKQSFQISLGDEQLKTSEIIWHSRPLF
jgi:hypothetical protein